MAGYPRFINRIEDVERLRPEEKETLKKVTEKFAFRTNEYYLSLINWDDPNDPIRRLVIPSPEELHEWGALDPSNEARYTVMRGVEHKYRSTVLFLVNNVCGSICRYCFRKRLFMKNAHDTLRPQDLDRAVEYVRSHPEVNNVLLTGGDPLMFPTRRLEEIISKLRQIDHVDTIRIGTKIPAFNPYRITEDPSLLEMIEKYSTPEKRIYIISHFSHPREITPQAIKAVDMLLKSGAILANQNPLIRGVNDDPRVLAELFNKLQAIGDPPYYVFQCRPASGNRAYSVPVEEAYDIVEEAKKPVSGLAKRARYILSHATGKVEVIAKTDSHILFRYHQAADPGDIGRVMIFRRNPEAYWLDDYLVQGEISVEGIGMEKGGLDEEEHVET